MKTVILFVMFLGLTVAASAEQFYYQPYSFVEDCGCPSGSKSVCSTEFKMLNSQNLNSAVSEFYRICREPDSLVLTNCDCEYTDPERPGIVPNSSGGCYTSNAVLLTKIASYSYSALLTPENRSYRCK